jgi:hypothetical protein
MDKKDYHFLLIPIYFLNEKVANMEININGGTPRDLNLYFAHANL